MGEQARPREAAIGVSWVSPFFTCVSGQGLLRRLACEVSCLPFCSSLCFPPCSPSLLLSSALLTRTHRGRHSDAVNPALHSLSLILSSTLCLFALRNQQPPFPFFSLARPPLPLPFLHRTPFLPLPTTASTRLDVLALNLETEGSQGRSPGSAKGSSASSRRDARTGTLRRQPRINKRRRPQLSDGRRRLWEGSQQRSRRRVDGQIKERSQVCPSSFARLLSDVRAPS